MQMKKEGMLRGKGSPHLGSGRRAGPELLPTLGKGRAERRRWWSSPWQGEMITMVRSIMVMIMSMIKNSESPFGKPEHACRRDCTAGGGGRGEGEQSRAGGKGCGGSTLR